MSELANAYDVSKTYWEGEGRFPQYGALSSELIPSSWVCTTYEGELLKAVTKIYVDLHQNGFGNNWSGAWYLLQASPLDIVQELAILSPHKCGRSTIYLQGKDTPLLIAVESLMNKAIEYVLSLNGNYTPSRSDIKIENDPDDFDGDYENEDDE